jgi:Terminase small subunit
MYFGVDMTTTKRKKEKTTGVKAPNGGQKTSRDRGRDFAYAYLANGHHATQAAIAAGYSPKSANQKGSDLLHRPDVVAILDAERKRLADENRVTVDRVVKELAELAFGFERDPIKVKSLELLGKTLGMFTDKIESKTTMLDADGNPTVPTVRVVFVDP